MKARLAGILAIVLLATFNFPAADAAAKPGMACKKVGSVAIAGAYKYICIKSGKKTKSSSVPPHAMSTSMTARKSVPREMRGSARLSAKAIP